MEFEQNCDKMKTNDWLRLARLGADVWNQERPKYKNQLVDFRGIDFSSKDNENISFEGFVFGSQTDFSNANFGPNTNFRNSTFSDEPKLGRFTDEMDYILDDRHAYFTNTTFGVNTQFVNVIFSVSTHFKGAIFGGIVHFDNASFGDYTDFSESIFFGPTYFMNTCHGNFTFFNGTVFNRRTLIKISSGESPPMFRNAIFNEPPEVSLGSEDDKLLYDFSDTIFKVKPGWFQFSSVHSHIKKIEKLRSITEANGVLAATRDLFILQRQAERGVNLNNGVHKAFPFIRPIYLWRGISSTFMVFLFGILSNFGRSITWPILWLFVSNIGFYRCYKAMYDGPSFGRYDDAILDYTLANSLPFGQLMNPAFEQAVTLLFTVEETTVTKGLAITKEVLSIPLDIQLAGMVHSLTSIVLLFLIGLAVRNYFRIG